MIETSLTNILFLDVETVPQQPNFKALSDAEKNLWANKARYLIKDKETHESIYNRAGIYAEFGKIICISTGYFSDYSKTKKLFRLKSFYGDDEKKILTDFAILLNKFFNKASHLLCAHNGKEFDFPYLSRRMLINGIKLPKALNISGKKPWEINHLDTMEMWRFGDYKNFTPLNLMAHVFGIPSPKDDIDGSKVWQVYWEEKNLHRIVTYCQKDVLTIAQIVLKMKGEELLAESEIKIIN